MSARRCEQAIKALNDMRVEAACERGLEQRWRISELPGCDRYPSYQEMLEIEAELDKEIPF